MAVWMVGWLAADGRGGAVTNAMKIPEWHQLEKIVIDERKVGGEGGRKDRRKEGKLLEPGKAK